MVHRYKLELKSSDIQYLARKVSKIYVSWRHYLTISFVSTRSGQKPHPSRLFLWSFNEAIPIPSCVSRMDPGLERAQVFPSSLSARQSVPRSFFFWHLRNQVAVSRAPRRADRTTVLSISMRSKSREQRV